MGGDIKRVGEPEDNLSLSKSEISEVTITEYRKNQIVKMGECVIGLGLIGVGIGFRKKIPTWLSVSLGIVGAGMTVYNGRNLYLNFRQDGKLIREAIKTKKVEEKKIRDELKKKSSPLESGKKVEQPLFAKENPNSKPDIKTQAGGGNNNGILYKNETLSDAPPANGKYNSAIETKAGNEVEAVLKKTNESIVREVNIIESAKKEGEEIIVNISSEKKIESQSVEATIISTEEKLSTEENGREAVR